MKIIKNSNTKMEFIQSSGVNSVFSTDITEICDLLLFEKGDFLIREGEIQNYLLFPGQTFGTGFLDSLHLCEEGLVHEDVMIVRAHFMKLCKLTREILILR